MTQLSQTLAALGNPTRLALIERLSAAESFAGLSISELAEGSGLTRQTVTTHLELLADAGILTRFKPGRATWYELKIEPLKAAMDALTQIASQQQQTQKKLDGIHREFSSAGGSLSGRN